MFCPNCGSQVPDDSAFCESCGTKLAGAPTPAPSDPFAGNNFGGSFNNTDPFAGNTMGGSSDGTDPFAGNMSQSFSNPDMNDAPTGGVGFAVTSMVLGIVSLVFCICFAYLTFFTAILSIVFAIISMTKKRPGRGMAIAGLVCSIISLVPAAIIVFAMGGAGLSGILSSM